MNEAHMAELERAMFVVSGARKRLERTAASLRLIQKTSFAVSKDQLTLA